MVPPSKNKRVIFIRQVKPLFGLTHFSKFRELGFCNKFLILWILFYNTKSKAHH